MNLVCSNDALPEIGSLFFKVLGNSTVTKGQFRSFKVGRICTLFLFVYYAAKFDCTVPGTLTDFIEECNITTTEKIQMTPLPLTATTTVPNTTDNPSASAGMHMITLNAFMSVVVVMGLALATTVVIIIALCCYIHLQRRPGVANQEDVLYSNLDRIDRHNHQISDQLETEGKTTRIR